MALAESSKGAGNGSAIVLDLLVERMEVIVSRVASYFTECSIIEVHFFVVDGFSAEAVVVNMLIGIC